MVASLLLHFLPNSFRGGEGIHQFRDFSLEQLIRLPLASDAKYS
jgi:hypothetical protein